MKDSTHAPGYVAFYPMLCEIAKSCGYSLAIHGSVQRDFDLVAIPWIEEANTQEALVEKLAKYADDVMGVAFLGKDIIDGPEEKPHGRVAYSIQLGNGAYLDISIMPRST
ncbi:hypothetical protein [Sulfurovum mangrovi]|uniref:hypothetical protein n=1 Tax=Sulfurovum mangrovi TaxID=2893889 RepID=UPI001E3298AF|nr:hypothetical protein [Sulfurovum mangrovi]UFH59852.1 hypothetical protein LN246_03165 [Sulfurovum mangrovi]UFH59903.1 hypothetical protein LN246_03425 [Sulfurovum mangrovi]